jgi:uncharacterized protein YfdQ (DUF2303 family)
MDKSAVDAINEGATTEMVNKAINQSLMNGHAHVAMPDNFNVVDLEHVQSFRRRMRGTMITASIPDFANYIGDNGEDGACVFVNQESMSAKAVLNLGTPEHPGHADNTAVLNPIRTAAYAKLRDMAKGQGLTQKAVAEWLEDWGNNIVCFDEDGETVASGYAIAAIRQITIESASKLESTVESLSESKSAFESVKATSKTQIPATIRFNCEPYPDFHYRAFVLRLGIRTGERNPMITLNLINAEKHEEEIALELAAKVTSAIGESAKVLLGTYSRSN